MCGIALILGKDSSITNVNKMLDIMDYRGPDNRGVLSCQDGVMGHVRLSIIDIDSRSNQPFIHEGWSMVFNGEIYNYVELKNFLIDEHDLSFTTESDTEVLLKGFILLKEDFLIKIRGAFAVCINKGNDYFIFRDTFGMKPLYLLRENNSLIVGSTVKAIASITSNKASEEARIMFQKFGFIPEPYTHFENITCVNPGTIIHYKSDEDSYVEKSFYSLISLYQNSIESKQTLNSDIIDTLNKVKPSIQRHFTSDVGCTIALSSGFDSVFIANYSNKVNHDSISIGFEKRSRDSEYNEASLIAKALGIACATKVLSKTEVYDSFQRYLKFIDLPTLDGFNVFLISELASGKNIRVLLSGLGGDEILGSYPSFRFLPIIWKLRYIVKPIRYILRFLRNVKIFNLPFKLQKFSEIDLSSFVRLYLWYRSILTDKVLYNKKNIYASRDSILKKVEKSIPKINNLPICAQISFLETFFYMRSQLLKYGDNFSMANSVELRTPFVDIDVYKSLLPFMNGKLKKKSELAYMLFPKEVSDQMALDKKKSFSTNVIDIFLEGLDSRSVESDRILYLNKIYSYYDRH